MNSVLTQFIKNELDAYIQTQRVYCDPVGINLIIKAFEAYEEYKRLVSPPTCHMDAGERKVMHQALLDSSILIHKGDVQDI